MRDLRRQAQKRVNKKKGFYIHFGVYAACALFFFLLNFLTGGANRGNWWFFYPVLGWGLGVAIHYLTVFGIPGTDILSKRWEEREIEEEMIRLGRHRYQERNELPDDVEMEKLELKEKELLRKEWDEDELV